MGVYPYHSSYLEGNVIPPNKEAISLLGQRSRSDDFPVLYS